MLSISSSMVRIRFQDQFEAPYWMGSMFRGAFGWNLRKIYCNDFTSVCKTCEQNDSCLFYYVMQRKDAKRGHAPPLKPILIVPPFFGKEMIFYEDPFLDLNLIFFGDFTRYIPQVILALKLIGHEGVGNGRFEGRNRFIIEKITCNFTNKTVFNGKFINASNLKLVDVGDLPKIKEQESLRIGFRTPINVNEFPLSLHRLIEKIRSRLIFFVNEYGTGEMVPEFEADAKISDFEVHRHALYRRSSRSGRGKFFGFTGKISYDIDTINKEALWLLKVGTMIGAGKDSSFGLGMIKIL